MGCSRHSQCRSRARWLFSGLQYWASLPSVRCGGARPSDENRSRHNIATDGGEISGVAQIYNRHGYFEEKRAALETWARTVLAIVEGGEGNVVEIRRAQNLVE